MDSASHITETTSRSKKFMKDFGVYAIGQLGNRLITFLLVPFYTYYIDRPGDYGIYDLCLNICFLLFPIISLQMRDGMFRFLLDTREREQQQGIITFGMLSLATTIALTCLIAVVLYFTTNIPYLTYTTILLISMTIAEVVSQTARGLGHNKVFVAQGLITTFLIGLLSVVFVGIMRLNAEGIFLANILARVVAIVITLFRVGILRNYFSLKSNYRSHARAILNYTIPLLPVAMFWWFTTSSDRMFIKFFIGADMNGIYAVAVRFAGVITMLAVIFYQTWQENAIQQYNSPDRNRFFSQVFNNYIFVLVMILSVYTFAIKMCYGWLVGAGYQESKGLIYISGMTAVLYSVSTYFDLPYQCAKDTKRAIPSVVVSACVNVALNLILVKRMGVYGVITTAIVSYVALIIYRIFDTRRYFKLTFYKRTIVPVVIMILGQVVYALSNSVVIDIIYIIAAVLVLAVAAPQETRDMATKVLRKFYHSPRAAS